jgi:predicted nucleotidyltransferase
MQLNQDFKDFLRLLNDHDVDYLLIGGYAVGYHGFPRATGDMDIWIGMKSENASRLVAVLTEFGFDLPEVQPDLFMQRNKIIRMGNAPVRIEIVTSISGVDFYPCYLNRIEDIVDGVPVKIIDLESLKLNKKCANRFKDLEDLENLP